MAKKRGPYKKKNDGHGPGRPTKKTPEIVEILMNSIAQFGHIELACGHAQIDRQTFYNWLNSDADFSTQIEYAKTLCGMRLAQKVEKEDPQGPWKLLKNVWPKLYRDRIEQQLEGPDGEPIEIRVVDYRKRNGDGT